jgi:hypothetical protein
MGTFMIGASRGLRFLVVLEIWSKSQISLALLSDGHTLSEGIGFEGVAGGTLWYLIPFLPKEVAEEWTGAALEGCDALMKVGAVIGSTTSMV